MGAAEQQYSLRWNDFHASILSSFRHLKDEEDFVDVTLACDGCSFTAHKVVLSACSPYFRRLLKANPCQHPIVILRDVKQKDMEALLRFMYNGEVHIGQEQLADFLKTAQTLQVRGLADVPTKENQKNSSTSESMTWPQSALGGSREHRDQDGAASPPPQKRSRNERNEGFSPSPSPNPSGEQEQMTRESLLGQALEGGGNQHAVNSQMHNKGQSDSSLQAHSTGDDSSTDDTANSEKCPVSDLVKSEPTDYENDPGTPNIEIGPADTPRAHSFPAALLGLQGMGLLPGPSGLHNSNQEANFGLGNFPSVSPLRPLCPYCGRVYSSPSNLRQHVINVHVQTSEDLWEQCDICGKRCKTKHYLINHKLQAHGIRQRQMPLL